MVLTATTLILAAELLTAAQDNMTNGFYRLNAEARMTLSASGFKPNATVKGDVRIVDEHEKEVGSQPLSFTTDAKGTWTGAVRLPTDRYGFFRVRVKTESGTTLPKVGSRPKGCITYAVAHAPEERRDLTEDECFFGLFADAGSLRAWLGMHLLYLHSSPVPDEKIAVQRMAERAAETWKTWGTAVPGNTRYLNVFCTPEARRYMKATTENRREAFTLLKDPEGRRHYRETYRRFVEATRAQFPDSRRIYECHLEPDLWAKDPEEVVEGFAAVYDVIKSADPESIVAGPDLCSARDVEYHRQVFKLGIARYIDAFAIHPYSYYPLEPGGFIRRLRAISSIVRTAKGPDVPLYATEAGFVTPATKEGELMQMNGIVRKQLILLGEGYRFSYAFYPYDYGNNSGEDHDGDYGFVYNLQLALKGKSTPKQRWGISRMSPRPVAPALSAASWYLDGRRPVSCIEYLGEGVHGYAYADKSDDVVIAVWDYGGRNTEIDLPVGRGTIRVSDHMGNESEVNCPGDVLHLRLSESPTYVISPDAALWGRKAKRTIRLDGKPLEVAAGETFEIAGETLEDGDIELCPSPALGIGGNRRTCAAGRFTFAVTAPKNLAEGQYPVMLRAFRPDGAVQSLAGCSVSVRAPVAIVSSEPTCSGGVFGVRTVVENLTAKPQKVTVETRVKGVPEARREASAELGAGERREVTSPCPGMEVNPFLVQTLETTCRLADGRRWTSERKVNFFAATPVRTESGDPCSWESPVRYPAGEGFRIAFGWNRDYLVVDAVVEDDQFGNDKAGYWTWDGDSLQIALAGTILEKSSSNVLRDQMIEAYTENTLALTSRGAEMFRTVSFDPEHFPIVPSGDGTISPADAPRRIEKTVRADGVTEIRYRAAFPWRFLGKTAPRTGESVYFAASLNDRDPDRADLTQQRLFDFKAAAPKGFGRIILAD